MSTQQLAAEHIAQSIIAMRGQRVMLDAERSQFATLKIERGRHRKYLPYAITWQQCRLSRFLVAQATPPACGRKAAVAAMQAGSPALQSQSRFITEATP